MPYISLDEMRQLASQEPATPGQLNYLITMLCIDYLNARRSPDGDFNYSTLNEVVGVLECAKLEFYRRAAAPYEDRKRVTNGDVYDF